jgi:hypothetical protein
VGHDRKHSTSTILSRNIEQGDHPFVANGCMIDATITASGGTIGIVNSGSRETASRNLLLSID